MIEEQYELAVLILVLMEDTLRVGAPDIPENPAPQVLILVLMEDTLRVKMEKKQVIEQLS